MNRSDAQALIEQHGFYARFDASNNIAGGSRKTIVGDKEYPIHGIEDFFRIDEVDDMWIAGVPLAQVGLYLCVSKHLKRVAMSVINYLNLIQHDDSVEIRIFMKDMMDAGYVAEMYKEHTIRIIPTEFNQVSNEESHNFLVSHSDKDEGCPAIFVSYDDSQWHITAHHSLLHLLPDKHSFETIVELRQLMTGKE